MPMNEDILPSCRPFEDAWDIYFRRPIRPIHERDIFRAGYDAGVANTAELAAKDELIRRLSDCVAICSELLASAERHRYPR